MIILILILSIFCYSQETPIRINQVGYLPSSKKLFMVVNSTATYFKIIEVKTNQVVYQNKFYIKIKDKNSGDLVQIGDFSKLSKEGTYYIEILPSKEKSYVFNISSNVYKEVFIKTMRSYYLQRCGCKVYDIDGKLIHNECHLNDAEFLEEHFGEPFKGIKKDFTGGWHDAGDYGKYIVSAGITCGTLLLMWEFNKEKIKDIKLNIIPKKYKNLPDVLEEIKYELDWFLKMQSEDGSVYFKVSSIGFPYYCLPEKDETKRYVYGISSVATANFAAVMSYASKIYKEYLPEYSKLCLEAAKKAWMFLEKNKEIVPKNGFDDPFLKDVGYEADKDDSDERLWAAVELYSTTGEKKYHNFFIDNYKKWQPTIDYPPSWLDLHVFAMIRYLLIENTDPQIKQKIKEDLFRYLDDTLNHIEEDGYRVALKEEMYYWGSNAVALNIAMLFIVGFKLTNNNVYLDAAFDQLCYVLGRNSLNKSFITKIGYNLPQNPHHSLMIATNNVLEGFLVGGPNKNLDDYVMYRNFGNKPGYPVAKMYVDIDPTTVDYSKEYKGQTSYASNEPCINYNAPLQFVLAEFLK